MKLLRRILIATVRIVAILAILFVVVRYAVNVSVSYDTVKELPAAEKIIPIDLKDKSVSNVPGMKLSYFGYTFDVPWTDLDKTQTKVYPVNKLQKNMVVLIFDSGLAIMFTAIPSKEWENEFQQDMHISPKYFEQTFGNDDYSFVNTIYQFTPDQMHHWTFSQRVQAREQFLLIMKSIVLSEAAEIGIYRVQNDQFKGFQQGSPEVVKNEIAVNLYSKEGNVQLVFALKKSATITQPEINRIIQSLHKVSSTNIIAQTTEQ